MNPSSVQGKTDDICLYLRVPILSETSRNGQERVEAEERTLVKRLSEKRRRWLFIRARNEERRKGNTKSRRGKAAAPGYHGTPVQIWQGGEPEYALCMRPPVPPPHVLCFSKRAEETTDFFSVIRRGYFMNGARNLVRRSSPNSPPNIETYFDFSKLAEISTSASVVLTAEYSRISILNEEVPPTVDINKWNRGVLTRLYQIGFFSSLGHIPDLDEKLVTDGPTLTMRIVRATNANELHVVDDALQELGRFMFGADLEKSEMLEQAIVTTMTAISEAITNVTQHAYPDDRKYEYPHVESFWVAATADRIKRTLTIVVYDQGASVPVTYPRMTLTEKIQRYLRRAIKREKKFVYENDGTYVRAAMRYGGSRTDKPYRGRGFPQMYDLIKAIGDGTLRIHSRGGWAVRGPGGRIQSGYVGSSIGGTLIEWTVSLA